MKKAILIFMMILTIASFGQNATWTGTKTINQTNFKLAGITQSNADTKILSIDSLGKWHWVDKGTIAVPQVQPDWNATSGLGKILNKPSFSVPTLQEVLAVGNGSTTSIRLSNSDNTKSNWIQDTSIGMFNDLGAAVSMSTDDPSTAILSLRSGNYLVGSIISNNSSSTDGWFQLPLGTNNTKETPVTLATLNDIPSYTTPSLNQVLNSGPGSNNVYDDSLEFGFTSSISSIINKDRLNFSNSSLEVANNITLYGMSLSNPSISAQFEVDRIRVGVSGNTNDFYYPNKSGGIYNLATTSDDNNLPIYANNSAAISGGLTVNKKYRTSTGQLMIVY